MAAQFLRTVGNPRYTSQLSFFSSSPSPFNLIWKGKLEEMAVNEKLTNVPEAVVKNLHLPWESLQMILSNKSCIAPNLLINHLSYIKLYIISYIYSK